MAERAHPDDIAFKDKWFGLKRNRYRARLFERYRFCNRYVRDMHVADVPCGTGWGTSMLKGYAHVHGIDISDEAVSFANHRFAIPDKRIFSQGSMDALPFTDSSKNVVICLEGFEHVSQEIGKGFLLEAKRVLEPDGLLIMTCPVLNTEYKHTGNPYHIYEYPEEELIGLLNDHFRVELLERIKGPDGPEYRTVLSNFKPQRYTVSEEIEG